MKVVAIRKPEESSESKTADTKTIEATQKAVDALPFDSGTWRVEGIPGLYIRCRAKSRSFFIQRRVEGELVREYLGELSMKAARAKAMKTWSGLRPKPAVDDVVILSNAIETYIQHRRSMNKMAPATEKLARYNAERYLEAWKDRTLEDIGKDRPGIMALHARLTRKYGPATCNQVMRLLSAVYRWHQDRIETDLPDWSRRVAEIHEIKPRDWAYSEPELRAWWHVFEEKDGKPVMKDGKPIDKGVSTLSAVKCMWWLTALLTGARKGSIEALQWPDLDLDKKTIHFRITKGDRPYVVPMSDTLADLLTEYRESDHVPPSDWVFPSNVIDGGHLKGVKNPNEGVGPAHRLRHTFRTTLAQIGATTDQARLLMGHSMGSDVSSAYITSALVIESLRPVTNAVAEYYLKIVPEIRPAMRPAD